MPRLLRHMLLLAALLGAPALGAQDLAPLQSTFELDRTALRAAVAEFESARTEWERVTAQVEALRRRVVADPFVAAALPDALREAHAVASELATLDARMRDASRGLEGSARALRDAATARLLALDAAAQAGTASAGHQAELARVQAVLDALEDPALRYEPPPLEAILGALNDDPDELRAIADELADHEARLARQLDEVRAGLERARARERLEQRVSALAFEERFFDDGGFRRSGATRAATEATTGTPTSGGARNDGASGGVSGDDAVAGGDRGNASAPDPGMPPASEGAPEVPAFGEGAESGDFDSAGGGLGAAPVVDVVTIPQTPAPGRLVDTTGASSDPTLRGLAAQTEPESARRRGRTRSSELSALEAALVRDLAEVRERRESIEAQAAEAERVGR